MENYFFLENYGTSEGAVSHNVLYHQPLPITRHQERFYANNYFEKLPIVSTAFNAVKWKKKLHVFSHKLNEFNNLVEVFLKFFDKRSEKHGTSQGAMQC